MQQGRQTRREQIVAQLASEIVCERVFEEARTTIEHLLMEKVGEAEYRSHCENTPSLAIRKLSATTRHLLRQKTSDEDWHSLRRAIVLLWKEVKLFEFFLSTSPLEPSLVPGIVARANVIRLALIGSGMLKPPFTPVWSMDELQATATLLREVIVKLLRLQWKRSSNLTQYFSFFLVLLHTS